MGESSSSNGRGGALAPRPQAAPARIVRVISTATSFPDDNDERDAASAPLIGGRSPTSVATAPGASILSAPRRRPNRAAAPAQAQRRDSGPGSMASVKSMGRALSVRIGLGGGDDIESPGRNCAAQWDVRLSPAAKKMVGGKYRSTLSGSLPSKLTAVRKKRMRIRIESTAAMVANAAGSSPRSKLLSPSMRSGGSIVGGGGGGSLAKQMPVAFGKGEASLDGSGRHAGDGGLFDEVDGPSLAGAVSADDEIIVKVLKPVSAKAAKKAKSVRIVSSRPAAGPGGGGARSFSVGSEATADDDSDDDSDDDDSDDGSTAGDTVIHDQDVDVYWRESYHVPIDRISVVRRTGESSKRCVVSIGTGKSKKEREIHFPDADSCSSFVGTIRRLERKMSDRAELNLRETLGSSAAAALRLRPVNLLVEIVSAVGLRDADVTGKSDPYILVRMGDRVLHKTQRIDDDLNPIWTLQTRSLFLIEDTMEDFIRGDGAAGVTFEALDYDSFGKHSTLGQVTLKQRDMMAMNGERVEYELRQIKAKHKSQGVLAIRCRKATELDVRFIHKLKAGRSHARGKGVASQCDFVSPVLPRDRLNSLKKQTKQVDATSSLYVDGGSAEEGEADRNTRGGKEGKELANRVRPYPDPEWTGDREKAEWMTTARVEEETYKPSRSWVEAGTGDLGKLYLEILGCDGLPNMDSGPNRNNKTDAFVNILFEDAIVSTDIVSDCLSPRFLPWTRRAFVLHVSHPTSPILLGVHDWDSSPINSNDPVGRVAVNLGGFAPNTQYTLHYRLYDTAVVPDRKQLGTITIRLSLEWNDTQALFKKAVEAPPRFYVNVQDKKNYKSAYYTIEGGKDTYMYSLETIQLQVDELCEIGNVAFDVCDAAVHVVMWRGHFKLGAMGRTVELPLHSMFAFISGILLVERPQIFPAIFTLSVGWFLLALLERRNSRPSQWSRVPAYTDMVRAYATGKMPPSQSVAAHQNEAEDEAYVEATTKKRTAAQQHVAKLYEEKTKEWEEVAEMMGEGGDLDDLTSRSTGGAFTSAPFKSYFYPYQVWFGQLCNTKRFVGSILTWDHYFLSFAITTASLIVGTVFLFVPWGFLFLWFGRLFVWVVLGPWMKLVDIYYVQDLQSLSDKDLKRREKIRLRKKKETLQDTMRQLQVQKENALKLLAMKKHVFGGHIVSMPHLSKLDRYRDEPLPQSTATPIPAEKRMESTVNIKNKVPGQSLEGTMIPENINSHVNLTDKEDFAKRSLIKKLMNRKQE